MGLNLPADAVCFFETSKFDGRKVRQLSPLEVQQIGGRAGRYGLAGGGEVGATSAIDLAVIRALHHAPLTPPAYAYIAPSVENLACIPGTLEQKLTQWTQLHSIPITLRGILQPADLQERIALASLLSSQEVERLGLEAAVVLTNAPTREGSRGYWLRCAQAILCDSPLPLPPEVPLPIASQKALEMTETAIACADVYLWLAQRREFSRYGQHGETVKAMRASWSQAVDEALASQLDTGRHCTVCRAALSIAWRYGVCASCYEGRRRKSAGRTWRFSRSGRSPTRTRKAGGKGKRKGD
jgi:ATP-dependent RNA helicase SUPV3L1/SUV3